MECFSCKGGHGICEYMRNEEFKRRVGLGYTYKRFWIISNIMIFETAMPQRN